MCSYLLRASNGVYYFRMGIPADLRPHGWQAGNQDVAGSKGPGRCQANHPRSYEGRSSAVGSGAAR